MARALYIHWPFCLAKCPYCDFNSHVRDTVDIDAWQSALLADMAHEAELAGGEQLESVFFGGGTPSLMPPALVERLLAEAKNLWGFASSIEITLEANPSSVEAANFADLASAGVNRVSLGLQALDDEALQFLGRLHDVNEGIAALDIAQQSFDRVSFDLIYARTGQSLEQWQVELARALDFGTGHLSLYQLTIEPGTRFATMAREGKLSLPDDDLAADLFSMTREITAAAGLPAYEISNHARPGEESRHNLTYWRYEDYCGIGPGAHGRRNGLATVRHRKPENWLAAVRDQGHGICETHALGGREQASEAMLMGLRLAEGVDLEALARRFTRAPKAPAPVGVERSRDTPGQRLSTSLEANGEFMEIALLDQRKVEFFEQQGLLTRDGDRLSVTDKGMPLLDALLGEIVAAELVQP